MQLEIERKFLLADNTWRQFVHNSLEIRQGYLCNDIDRTVRIRTWGPDGKITVKGKSINGVRDEYEYNIPFEEAVEMIQKLCLPGLIHKIRHFISIDEYTWEIDEFLDHNDGLFLAEVELKHRNAAVQLPTWIGKEVTNDHRFQNSHLATNKINLVTLLDRN